MELESFLVQYYNLKDINFILIGKNNNELFEIFFMNEDNIFFYKIDNKSRISIYGLVN